MNASWRWNYAVLVSILMLSTMFVTSEHAQATTVEEILDGADLNDAEIDWEVLLGRGDIIGNGAGLGEMQFQYMYHSIPQFIRACIRSNMCPINEVHRSILMRIQVILNRNRDLSTKLIFLSSKDHPNFFKSEDDPELRIAKTGFRPDIPIFIDIEQVYEEDGDLALGSLEVLSILVHEVGHQTGERRHSYLDDLATRLRRFVEIDFKSIHQSFEGREYRAETFNFQNPDTNAKLFVVLGTETLSLDKEIAGLVRCEIGRRPVGFRIGNLHWHDRAQRERERVTVKVKAWLEVACMDQSAAIWMESSNLFVHASYAPNQGVEEIEFKVRIER